MTQRPTGSNSTPAEIATLANHTTVCICTFKRPLLLKKLLEALENQTTENLFTYSIVVVDNDRSHSGESIVEEFAATSSLKVKYCVEPNQNIARARNLAIENATGNYVAFIDDDEFPTQDWLLRLFNACHEHKADGILGPVRPYFEGDAPRWVVDGQFYQRQIFETGHRIEWTQGLTCNVFLKRSIFDSVSKPYFRPEFRSGEDQDFFQRLIEKGHFFVWSNDALVYEAIPPARWRRMFMVRMALLRGATSILHSTAGRGDLVKSLLAVPIYAVILPIALAVKHAWFMQVSIRLFYHVGRLLAGAGINPIKQAYVTE